MTIGATLDRARDALRTLEEARNDLLIDALGAFTGGSVQGLLDQIDRWVGETFPRLEKKAIETNDLALASRLEVATINMIQTCRGTSPRADEWANAAQSIAETAETAKGAAKVGAGVLGAGVAVYLFGGLVLALVLGSRR